MADRDLTGRTLGEFVLREQIGEGGYGAVYRCTQPVLKRDAVIKVLHDRRRTNGIAQERFLREARLASRLDHPYAAHIYASGVEPEDGLLWIAMELVQGITLDRWLATRGPMPLDQFVPFFERIAQVVQAAHDCGIVHRDLKPSNMMVVERDGLLLPKLLDFGIAKAAPEADAVPTAWPEGTLGEHQEAHGASGVDGVITARIRISPTRIQRTRTNPDLAMAALPNNAELTRPGAGLGSSAYMSPEQWSNAREVGPASDVYSLGVVAYESLTGQPPFVATSTDEFYRCHVDAPVPHLGGEFSPELDRVLQRALAKSPEARHGNVLALAAELGAALRATAREQIRVSALQWKDRANAPGLLWGPDVLADFERWSRRSAPGALSALECSFVAASQRRARRGAWVRRLIVAFGVLGVLGMAGMQVRLAREQTRSAEDLAKATITQSELEQGRAALLHGEPGAQMHLGEAYKRDPAPSTAFMLARALQPRLAELAKLASSSGRMWSATFSPDGKQIVTTDEKNAQVWDAQTYQRLFVLPHGDAVYHAVYSADSMQIVTAGSDGSVRIWDAAHGALVRELSHSATAKLQYGAVAVAPDGRLVAAINTRGDMADVWETATGRVVAQIPNDAAEFPAIAFSADGRWLATTGGNDVRALDINTRQQTVITRGPRIHTLAFDPTGPRLITGAMTGDVAIWEIASGTRLQHLREIGEPVDAVAFSPDGQLVVAASRDGTEQVWRARSGELQTQLNPRHNKILAAEFDATSKLVLAAGNDGAVVVADVVLGMPVTVLEAQNGVRAAHFDPSSHRVVGASSDGTARVWDTSSPYRRWGSSATSFDCGIVTTPEADGRFIAVGCKDHPTKVWDTARDRLLAELPSVTRVDGNFTSAFPAVSRTGDRAAIARGNTVEVYELPGGRLLRTVVQGAPVNAVAFAQDGRSIISGAIDGSLVATLEDGTRLAFPTAAGGIDAVAFLADGRVVSADARRQLRVYDPRGAILASIDLAGRAMALRVEGTQLVTIPQAPPVAAGPGLPVLLDLERYRVVGQLTGHIGRVFSARWVTGHQILTAGADGTARLWDGATGALRKVYVGGSSLLSDATLTDDGMVVAGGVDGLLRFWDHGGRLLWALPVHKSQLVGVHVEGDDLVTRGFTGEVSRWRLPSPMQVIGRCSDHDHCDIVQP